MELKNEDRFTRKADIYKKFRPTYPKEIIDYLYTQVGFNQESTIADIGSGTGIFSRLLLERGSFVYCVEPNDDMRQVAERDLSEFENFASVNAPAENTGLQDKSVDFITAAQAFHWFDRQIFRSECRRILRSGGKVVIAWNTRDNESEVVKRENSFREKYSINKKGMQDGGKLARDWSDFFAEGICEHKTCRNDLTLDHEAYIGINLSRSWAPREEQDSEKYQGLINELGVLFDKYSVNGILKIPYFAQSYIGRL